MLQNVHLDRASGYHLHGIGNADGEREEVDIMRCDRVDFGEPYRYVEPQQFQTSIVEIVDGIPLRGYGDGVVGIELDVVRE